jgi:uroporphyrin-III C-methyltransferase
VARCADISAQLQAGGLPGGTPAAVVSAAHTPAQRQAITTLADLPDCLQREGLGSPALLVIGDVVRQASLAELADGWSSAGWPQAEMG